MKPFINILFGVLLVVLVGVGQVRGQVITEYPYIEDFDGETLTGWGAYDYDGDGENWGWYIGQSLSHSGNQFLMSWSENLNPDNLLYTPHFIVPTQGELMFSWWVRSLMKDELDKYDIVIATNNGWIWEDMQRTAPYNWTQYSISLQNYAGEEIYIVFDHWHSNNKSALLIDDVSIEWDNPLPIVLLDFYAEPRPGFNILTIITGYEYNNCEFIVYRSRDAINWDYNNPVCDWDFGRDSALYNEALDTVLNYFNMEHPNGQTYYPIDYEPYDTTYYKLVQRDCDGRLTEYESEIIVCVQEPSNKIEPHAYTDNGIVLVAGDRLCDVYVYTILGTQRYTKRMYPGETGRLNYWGHYIVEFIWVDENTYDIKKKVYKLFNIE